MLSLNFHAKRPAGTLRICAHGWQSGGGLLIEGTATLINTNVYSNQANYVCSPFKLSVKLSSSAPMELDLALAARRAVAS